MAIPRSAQWAFIPELPRTEITPASPCPNDDHDARPILTAAAIFHPPRLTSYVD